MEASEDLVLDSDDHRASYRIANRRYLIHVYKGNGNGKNKLSRQAYMPDASLTLL